MASIKAAGAAGLLVPDLPLEGTQTEGIQEAAEAAGIELVLLATPTTPVDRMKIIAEQVRRCIYTHIYIYTHTHTHTHSSERHNSG